MRFNTARFALAVTLLSAVAFSITAWAGGWFSDDTKEVTLEELLRNPEKYKGDKVVFTVYFNRIAEQHNPYFTEFHAELYNNFSAWPIDARLYEKRDFQRCYPHFFVDRSAEGWKDVKELERFDVLECVGIVKHIFQGRPYIEIIEADEVSYGMDAGEIKSAIRAAAYYLAGDFNRAAKLYERALKGKVPGVVRADLNRRLGDARFGAKRYDAARAAYKRAQRDAPKSAVLKQNIAAASQARARANGDTAAQIAPTKSIAHHLEPIGDGMANGVDAVISALEDPAKVAAATTEEKVALARRSVHGANTPAAVAVSNTEPVEEAADEPKAAAADAEEEAVEVTEEPKAMEPAEEEAVEVTEEPKAMEPAEEEAVEVTEEPKAMEPAEEEAVEVTEEPKAMEPAEEEAVEVTEEPKAVEPAEEETGEVTEEPKAVEPAEEEAVEVTEEPKAMEPAEEETIEVAEEPKAVEPAEEETIEVAEEPKAVEPAEEETIEVAEEPKAVEPAEEETGEVAEEEAPANDEGMDEAPVAPNAGHDEPAPAAPDEHNPRVMKVGDTVTLLPRLPFHGCTGVSYETFRAVVEEILDTEDPLEVDGFESEIEVSPEGAEANEPKIEAIDAPTGDENNSEEAGTDPSEEQGQPEQSDDTAAESEQPEQPEENAGQEPGQETPEKTNPFDVD